MTIHNAEIFQKNPKLLKGNLQIIACAGSGKTEFVSERIAYQIYKGIAKPDQIVAFTFTEKAAEELKFRIRFKIKELIGKQTDIGDMYIGTIHAFAFKILQDFIPRYRAYDMLDEVKRLAFISSIKRDMNINHLIGSLRKRHTKPFRANSQNWAFKTFIKDIDLYREERLDEEAVICDSFKHAMNVYMQKLDDKRFLDFSSILRIATDTLEDDVTVRQNIQNQYQFFTVDEYQDVNPIQENLIQLISGKKNVCVVGDDDQSIYQWRGADVNNILTFKERYKDVSVHCLETNRRSHDGIVKTASKFISSNPKRLPKTIKDKGIISQEGDLYKILFKHQEEEIEWIIDKIRNLIGTEYRDGDQVRKLKYSDIAFLFRSIRTAAKPYIEALEKAGIPVVYSGTGGLFEADEVVSVMRIFEYICDYDKENVYDNDFLRETIELFPEDLHVNSDEIIERIEYIKELTRKERRLSFQRLFGNILSILGISDEHFHREDNEVMMYNLGRLSMAISDYENSREYLTFNSLKDFIWFIRLHAEKSYDSGTSDSMSGHVDAVQILTMHGTKGLGFPVVFMPGHFGRNHKPDFGTTLLDVTKFDSDRFINKPEDERRIYYVAMTRSKKYLFVTSAEYKIDGQNRATRLDYYAEIPEEYFITKPVDDPTVRKPCKNEGVSEEVKLPTSYSELAYYLNCGYDYKIRFVYGFNPELVDALGFGKQVHNIINLLHKDYEKTKKIPTVENIKKIIDDNFYLRYASDSTGERLKNAAFKSLMKYVKMWEKDFSLTVKTERPFELEFENALISGSIDMIKREGDEGSVLEVIEFKTGKPDNELKHRYDLQVQLYTIAAQEALGINTQKALIHYIDTDRNDRQEVLTSEIALETAREEISYAIQGISRTDFKRDARQNKTCKTCDWKLFCPKRKGYKE